MGQLVTGGANPFELGYIVWIQTLGLTTCPAKQSQRCQCFWVWWLVTNKNPTPL